MIFKIIYVTLFSLLFTQVVNAQTEQTIPIYNSKTLEGNTLRIKSDSGNLKLTAYKANVIKLTFFDTQEANNSDFVDSLTIPVNVRATQNIDDVFFSTDSLWVIVSKYDLSVRFLKKTNEELLLKCGSYFLNNSNQSILFELQKDENPLVADLKKLGKKVDLKSGFKKLRRKKSACEPAIISAKGYALYFKHSTNKKVQLISTDHHLKVNESFYPKIFFFLSGNFDEIEGNLKSLN